MRDITNPVFHDEEKARAYFERERWPHGVICPFCNSKESVGKLNGDGSMGPGWFYCNLCDQKKFTVRTGSVMERSHIPLTKWALGFRLMCASKKGMSAKQLERMLGISYRAAWFMAHRIREAMSPDASAGPLGGQGKVVESDETFVGGKKRNVHKGKPEPRKHAVHALVERGGQMRAKHIADVSASSLRETLAEHAHPKSELHTDDALAYYYIGREFAKHRAVNHSRDEYVSKDGKAHVQSAEAFFALLKRGVYGTFHSISEKHLQRYVDEFAFRWNTRQSLGIEDVERASRAVKGAAGKRLTYRRPDETAQRRADDGRA